MISNCFYLINKSFTDCFCNALGNIENYSLNVSLAKTDVP